MKSVSYSAARNNLKELLDKCQKEAVLISRRDHKNAVILGEETYKKLIECNEKGGVDEQEKRS